MGLASFGLLELDNHPQGDQARPARRPAAGLYAGGLLCGNSFPDPLWTVPQPLSLQIQDALLKLTGGRSVPRVFIGGKFVGGGDDTAAMGRDGRLKAALVAAGAM